MKKKRSRILPLTIALLVVVVIFILTLSVEQRKKENHIVSRVNSSWLLLSQLNKLHNSVQKHVVTIADYVHGTDKNNISPVQSSDSLILQRLDSVKVLFTNESAVQPVIDSLSDYVKNRVELSNQIVSLGKEKGLEEAAAFFLKAPGSKYSNRIFSVIDQMGQKEMTSLQKDEQTTTDTIKNLSTILTVLRLFTLLLVFFIVRKVLLDFSVRKRLEKHLEDLNKQLLETVEQKTVEIRKNEEQYRMVVENKILGVAWASTEGKVLNANQAFCDMLGYTLGEIKGIYFGDFTHPDDAAKEVQLIGKMEKGEIDNYVIEKRYCDKNGNYFWVELNLTCYRDLQSGKIEFFIGIVQDIQEQKQFEEALKASEKKLRQVLSSYGDVFYVIDNNYQIILINEIAEKNLSLAWGKPVTLGANLLELIPKQSDEPIKRSFEKVFAGEKVEYELKLSVKGLPAWSLVTYTPVKDYDGKVIGAYIITKDISIRKKAQEDLQQSFNRFELISRTTNDAIWEWDLETGQLWSNETHQQLYELTMEDPVPTEGMWEQRMHPDDKEEIVNRQQAALDSDKNVFISEYRFNVEGKGYRNIYDRCYIVRNQTGKAVRMMGSMMDVTERKKMEDDLRKSEERYRILVETATEALVVFDVQERKFVSVSESASRLFRMSKEELLKIGPVEVSPEYQPNGALSNEAAAAFISRAVKGEKTSFEWTHCDRNGNLIPCEVWLVRLPAGNQILVRGTIIDITERKKAEAAIKESEAKFRAFFESSMDGILLTVPDGRILAANPAACSIFGMTEEEICAAGRYGLVDESDPKLQDYLDERKRIGKTKGELTMLRKDGTKFPADITTSVFRDAKGDERTSMIIRDITERKRIEQELKEAEIKFRNLVEQSLVGVYIIQNGKFAYVNPRFAEIFGYNQQELINSYPVEKVVHPDDRALVTENVRVRLQGEKDSVHYEANGQKKNGEIIRAEIFGSRTEYAGKPAIIGTLLDISHRKQDEEQIKQSYNQIRLLTEHLQNIREEERTHIAREIHDELGQQLTVLKMDASWLNKKLNAADDNVKQKLKDLLELMDSTVKTVRRISSELRPSLLDDMGLVPAMEWHLKEFEKRASIKTSFKFPDYELNLQDSVKTGLFRIFQESLTNVVRHANAKKVEVNLKKENENIVLSIKDDGKGFDKKKEKNKKTLGILGMQERSFMMGGTYQIDSKPGKGTLVVVSVPGPDK